MIITVPPHLTNYRPEGKPGRRDNTMMKQNRVAAIEEAIAKKEIANSGRWCEVKIKKTGDIIQIIRLGYGPMERPEWDAHKLVVNGQELAGTEFRNLRQVAAWIDERY